MSRHRMKGQSQESKDIHFSNPHASDTHPTSYYEEKLISIQSHPGRFQLGRSSSHSFSVYRRRVIAETKEAIQRASTDQQRAHLCALLEHIKNSQQPFLED